MKLGCARVSEVGSQAVHNSSPCMFLAYFSYILHSHLTGAVVIIVILFHSVERGSLEHGFRFRPLFLATPFPPPPLS